MTYITHKINKINILVYFNSGKRITYHCYRITILKKSIWLYFKHRNDKFTYLRLNIAHIEDFHIYYYKDNIFGEL